MANEKVNEKIWLVDDITPMKSEVLADIDHSRAELNKKLKECERFIKMLTKKSQKIDLRDARQLECALEARDIMQTAMAISQYIGITKMLLENMNDDLRLISTRRKMFMQNYLIHAEQLRKEEKAEECKEAKKAKDRERKKRAASEAGK